MGKVLYRTRYVIHYVSSPPSSPSPTPISQDAFAATAMDYFGHGSLARELFAKDGVHNLENLLSLTPDMHSQFDALGLWFEATEAVCLSVDF